MLPIADFPSMVKDYLGHFDDLFTKPQRRHFAEYVTGLLVSPNRTIEGINNRFINHRHPSAKNRFFTESEWSEQEVDRRRLDFIKKKLKNVKSAKGYLAIDDVLTHKTGKYIAEVGKYWNHATGTYTWGHNLVTSEYIWSGGHFPIGFRLYRKYREGDTEFKTKNQLACELIDQACKLDLPFDTMLIDSWFFNKEVTSRAESRGKGWVAACKTNRVIITNNQRIQIQEFVKRLPDSAFKPVKVGTKTCWYFTKVYLMSNQGRVRLVFLYETEDRRGNPFVLVTNRLTWDVKRIVRVYTQRWPIETFYPDSKQNLGLEDYELRDLRGIKRHWYLVFLAYTLLQLNSMEQSLGRWFKSNLKTIGEKCRFCGAEIVRSFILWVIERVNEQKGIDEIATLAFYPEKQLRFAFE